MPPYIEVLAMENRPRPHPNKACSAIYNHIDLLLPDDRKLDGFKPRSGAFEKGLGVYDRLFLYNHCAATQAGKLSFGEILDLSFIIWLSIYSVSSIFKTFM